MQFADITRGMGRAIERFDRWFPMPAVLAPRSVGIDISDASVKWIGFDRSQASGHEIFMYGSESLADGVVSHGMIRDASALSETLRRICEHVGSASFHAALPEEAAYVFNMHIPAGTPYAQAMKLIEFEFAGRVPIGPDAAVYDFDPIGEDVQGLEIGVSVFPREVSESYASTFEAAGVQLASLELEARSAARAVSSHTGGDLVELLVDFGGTRTGFSVLKNAIPIFTSTVDLGSSHFNDILMRQLSLSSAEAERIKNDEGLFATDEHKSAREELVAQAGRLADEVARHFHFWDTRRDEQGKRMTPVASVTLVGGGANLKGLADFIAGKVQAPVERGNVWRNIFSFDEHIPPIDRRTSLQYATAVGLALRGMHPVSRAI